MQSPPKIKKLDEVVVNRIAAGEIIQRPANALKELIENSLDAKSTNIQITVKDGGLKLLQIQDNGTGIRKEDMEIVCERFTTSKLEKFDDLKSISTFGFRGEALASISHVALLTITTKTVQDQCGYKASYIDSKLKGPPKPCAGNQGTTITIENLFYNVATRRKALSSASEEFAKIADVVTRYSVHNANVGFTLKKHGEVIPQVRTTHNSTKMNNIKILYGNPVARELIEVENDDETYKYKMHALITNPNYSSKRLTLLLFINNRLVDSTPMRKMLEELYSIYLPKKTYPWCYISLVINPSNLDVNIHPTKHEVRFLHEEAIIERIKESLDEKLSGNNASRTFYLQAKLPQVDITRESLNQVLPEYDKENPEQTRKIHAREMIRTSSSDQKLDKFNFTVQNIGKNDSRDHVTCHNNRDKDEENLAEKLNDDVEIDDDNSSVMIACGIKNVPTTEDIVDIGDLEDFFLDKEFDDSMRKNRTNIIVPATTPPNPVESHDQGDKSHWSELVDGTTTSTESPMIDNAPNVTSGQRNEDQTIVDDTVVPRSIFDPPSIEDDDESSCEPPEKKPVISEVAERALKNIYKYYGTQEQHVETLWPNDKNNVSPVAESTSDSSKNANVSSPNATSQESKATSQESKASSSSEFKSYTVNKFRIQVKLRSILTLRKDLEDNYHEGLRDIINGMTFVGSVDEKSAIVQSGLNLYICDTMKLAEELFYEIMLYDFANYGVFKFSEPLPIEELAMLGLEHEDAGWTEDDGPKEEIATRVKELLLEKADMLKEYFSIVIDKRGNLKSLPVLLDKYVPCDADIPLFVLRLSTEVDWATEQPCFAGICRETAKFYSHIDTSNDQQDWQHTIEHVLYPAIKESLLPPKHFSHDSTILQIANLPDLYKVFERC